MIHPILRLIIFPIERLWLRKVYGLENAPKDKPFILVSNHASYYDALLLPSILIPFLNRRFHPLVNSLYWNFSLTRFFVNCGRCITVYIDRKSKKNNSKAMQIAKGFIRKKEIIQIYPEGTRSHDGKLGKAYHGAARLALEARIPVLPAGLVGTSDILPRGKILPRLKRCEVKIGKLMHFDKYYGKSDKKTLETVTREIMIQIGKLIGQKYRY